MSGNYKRTNSSLFGCCHETTEGTADYERTSDSIGTTTTFVDSSAPGADDDWKNYYIYAVDGANAGLARKVTGFTAASGTYTHDAFPNAMASGVKAWIFNPLPAKASEPSLDAEKIERDFETLTYDPPSHIVGLKSCSGSFDLEVWGCETVATTSAAAEKDRISHLLMGLGSRLAGVSDTVQASPSPTDTDFTVSDGTRFTVGHPIMVNGETRVIEAISTNAITVKPALTAAPSSTDPVGNSEVFVASEEGQRSFTFLYLRDDQLTVMTGCKINVKGTFKWGAKTMLQVEYQGTSWEKYDSISMTAPQSTKKPFAWVSGAALYDLDSVAVLPIQEFDFDFGAVMEEERDSVSRPMVVNDRKSTARVKFRTTNKTQKDNEVSGKIAEVLVQMGTTVGNAMCVWLQGQYSSLGDSDNAGLVAYDGELKHIDDQTDAANAQRMMFARF